MNSILVGWNGFVIEVLHLVQRLRRESEGDRREVRDRQRDLPATLPGMVAIGAAVLLAFFVVPAPWGIVLVGSAIVWEIAEKAFWFYYTKRIPLAVGAEALIGRPVEVLAACRPDGTVRLWSERWRARCSEGADVGDTVIVEAVEQLTLIVSSTRRGLHQASD